MVLPNPNAAASLSLLVFVFVYPPFPLIIPVLVAMRICDHTGWRRSTAFAGPLGEKVSCSHRLEVRVEHVPVPAETRVRHHVVYLPAHSWMSLLLLLLVLLLLLLMVTALSDVVLLRRQRAGRLIHLCR